MDSETINIADNFFGMIKNMSPEVKLDLISRISESMKPSQERVSEESSLHSLFGAFQSQKSADEIIDDLKAQRLNNRDIEKL